jgi:TRAP-type C4-dicarboxylate transport system substrate-binding protein
MGEIVTDTEQCYGVLPEELKTIWLKQLTEYSKRLDALVEETEKTAFNRGFDSAKGVPLVGYEEKFRQVPWEVKPKSQRLVPDVPVKNKDLEQMEK